MLQQKDAQLTPFRQPTRRPYPFKYVRTQPLSDGTQLRIRPIRPADEPQLIRFHASLSEHSVYYRYFSVPSLESRTSHERLARVCFIDYDQDLVLVAELMDDDGSGREIVGVGRLAKLQPENVAEVAAVVSDQYQRRGIGRAVVRELVHFASDEKIDMLRAWVLAENMPMQKLLKEAGFSFLESDDPATLTGEMLLRHK